MWQRFTERARRVILMGQEYAGKISAGNVGTEHLLLGLMRVDDGTGALILRKVGVELDVVRALIMSQAEPSNAEPLPEPKLTHAAKRTLELAADEARKMRHNYIGTEHMLLALLRQKDELAAVVLHSQGLDLEEMRTQVLDYLGAEDRRGTEHDEPPRSSILARLQERRRARMLLEMIEAGDPPSRLLVECGLDTIAARERLKKFLNEP
jgi:ATP-dependent Clp protease ATP-binding subunit ClpC